MPELPEVETYRRFIDEVAVGQTITGLDIVDKHVLAVPEDELRAAVLGRTITGTGRLGKNCFLELDNGRLLVLHFGMTGDIGAYRDAPDAPRFTRVAWQLSDSGLNLAFIDPRKFGRIRLADSVEAYQKAKKLGPDALQISAAELHQKLSRRKVLVKPLLLDQSLTAGLGNWIVDEVLFQAKIHPERLGSSLTPMETALLHAAIQEVLTTAIRHEANYKHFPKKFLIHAREWDDSATPGSDAHTFCPRHAKVKIEKYYVGGRATYTCPVCQPAPVSMHITEAARENKNA
ncbi:DNA-formamidopyrimidine glycosylase [Hymenobacter baengnokdamensis]|uniref:DNA-formamidopyrimidine glycosylase n=1 Tax=Hymenobacter baengnokdamensis TaxID=2615203 RepID=UPI001245EADF|nr:DNA-formamidopyrimidine glycosylase [Hymenobacter baengnokdamensis]